MNKPRYTAEEVAEALRAAYGVHADAAMRLGCHRTTILDYIRRYPEARQAYEEARAVVVDKAESQLIALVDSREWPAIRFVLVTLGRDRGYDDRRHRNEMFVEGSDEDDNAAFQRALDLAYGPPDGQKADGADGTGSEETGKDGSGR